MYDFGRAKELEPQITQTVTSIQPGKYIAPFALYHGSRSLKGRRRRNNKG